MRSAPGIRLLPVAVALLSVALLVPAAAGAEPSTVWLCKPGIENDPCKVGLKTTRLSPTGEPVGTKQPKRSRPRRIDCFYVYPTVSTQPTQNANRVIDPELRSIALNQAARYSQHCRVYAPVYRQVTLAGLFSGGFTEEALAIGYADVRRAWREFNRSRDKDRGVVLIGHSQGTFVLERLVAEEIDPKRAARRRLVAALLLGGGITVEEGSDLGGSFEHLRACRSGRQLSCVIAFSAFNEPVPPIAPFGRTSNPGEEVLCTNPAALGGGSGRLRYVYPGASADTPWFEVSYGYRGRCTSEDGADVLQVEEKRGARKLPAAPTAAWGLHLFDASIALGNLVELVREKGRRFIRSRD